MPTTKEERARIARENGAKSRGPKTAEGWARCQNAARIAAENRHALTFDCTLLPTESRQLRDAIAARELAHWRPSTQTDLQMVHEIVDINWRIRRLRYAQTYSLQTHMETLRLHGESPSLSTVMAAEAELEGTAGNGIQTQLDRRIERLVASRSRLIRDLERSKKRIFNDRGSQPALQTQHLADELAWRVPSEDLEIDALAYAADPESLIVEPTPQPEPQVRESPDILTWARRDVQFHPDPFQADLLTTQSKGVLVLGGRQTGKSTAAAVRVVYEAVFHFGSTVLIAGPTGRQSGQIMEKARKIVKSLGITPTAPPPGCDGFQLANGSAILSLPDNDATVRGFSAPRLIVVDEAAFVSDELFQALQPMLAVSNGAMILLSTPNGQSGFFYERWRDGSLQWRRIACRASDCPRISPEALLAMRKFMSREEYDQEFNCEFLASPGPAITPDLFRKCIRPEVKPLFEEERRYDW